MHPSAAYYMPFFEFILSESFGGQGTFDFGDRRAWWHMYQWPLFE